MEKGFLKKEWGDQLRLMEKSPLVRWGKDLAVDARMALAIGKAECKKTFLGGEYLVVWSDDRRHFFVMPEDDMSRIFGYMKRRRFMRRPDMRDRIAYSTR